MSASPKPPELRRGGPPVALTRLPIFGPLFAALRDEDPQDNAFALAALERHKREGMALAIRARTIAMIIVALVLPMVNPQWEVLWYIFLLGVLILLGQVQIRVAQVGQSRAELGLIVADILIVVAALVLPNPFDADNLPLALQYRVGGFVFLFVFLALATLAYSWRTVWGFAMITSAIWMLSYGGVEWFGHEIPWMTEAVREALPAMADELVWVDPNSAMGFVRVQEIVAFLIVGGVLATTVRRFSRLLMGHAALERERTNLARYFSPNVVDELSRSDQALKQVRTQNIAVLFVDIVGFTSYAANRPSAEVIETLREFHGRMEHQVFAHGGTLDKYLGDGLMATFGTPFAGERDATNALECARAMNDAMAAWNDERKTAGEPELRASFGLHFGPAVLGDIGANRLEFAVIGNTVNVASRVEALTRALHVEIAATAALKDQVERETAEGAAKTECLTQHPNQTIRGLDNTIDLWTFGDAPPGGATIH